MHKHIIVKQHEGGFFSNFNKVISFLEKNSNTEKITWDLKGQPFGAFAFSCGEVFSHLFLPYNTNKAYDQEEILREYIDQRHTGKNAHDCYTGNQDWRLSLNQTYRKYITPTEFLHNKIKQVDELFVQISNKQKIGILKRNDLLKCEQQQNKMPDLLSYSNEIKKIYTKDSVLVLSVDNTTDLNFFKNKYKPTIFSPIIRRTNVTTDVEPHFTPGTHIDAATIFLDVYMLSKCDYFIHPVSNMATAALYLNPKLVSRYLF